MLALCVLLLSGGCGSGEDASPAPPRTTTATWPTDGASPSAAGPARIPETSGPPEALASGTYLTPEGFAPELSVELPRGWWGGGGTGGWVVGKGNDPARQAFTGPSLWVDVVTMPWRDAVTALGKVDRVRYSAPPERSTLDGHRTMTFHATPQGREPVLLDEALGLGSLAFS